MVVTMARENENITSAVDPSRHLHRWKPGTFDWWTESQQRGIRPSQWIEGLDYGHFESFIKDDGTPPPNARGIQLDDAPSRHVPGWALGRGTHFTVGATEGR